MPDINAKNIGQIINNPQGNVEQHVHYHPDRSTLPNSIPSPQGFVGREEYLNELRESYQKGTRCCVLHGTGGVGKTALALQFAKEIAGEFQAKIFVEMQGMSQTPLAWRDAMFDIVRQFEREISAEISDAQLKTLFVQFVQNQPTLIVLDNAANQEAVESLKQADACFVITSREAFALMDGVSRKVSQMSPEDARQLLFKTGGDEQRFEGRADELAELAGYLPMALKPLASILKEDELETVGDLIERYRDKKELLKERVPDYDNLTIEASFELSYEKLSDEMKARWRFLSVFPADFDQTAISAVLDISIGKSKAIQKRLRRFNLLEVNLETNRFSLHDLIRTFVKNKNSAEEYFQTSLLFAKHYASVLLVAQNIEGERRRNYYLDALKLVDVEWINIITGQRWVTKFLERDDAIAELCIDYSGYARVFTHLRLYPREDIRWLESGLKAARKIGHRHDEGTNLGNAYHRLGDYAKAVEYHKQHLDISKEINNLWGQGASLGSLGIGYDTLGDHQKAIEFHEQHLEISRKLNDSKSEGASLGNLGVAYYNLKNYEKAIEFHEKSLEIFKNLGDLLGEGNSLGNLGLAYNELGDYKEAVEYNERYLIISKSIGNLPGEGNSLFSLGLSYKNLGERKKSCDAWKKALAIFELIESPNVNLVRQCINENGC